MQLADEILKQALEDGNLMEVQGRGPAALRRASMDLTRALAEMRRITFLNHEINP